MEKGIFKNSIKTSSLVLGILIISLNCLHAQTAKYDEGTKQELINLSKQKWEWMAERNVDSLDVLFHEEAVFIHMGGTMNKKQELNTIKSGGIHYKHAEIKETSVRFVDNTAIILDRIRLTAVVGGNEVVNPFMVTEIYVLIDGKWKLGSLSFTRLLGD
ncbi:nuclear transport factor 2 family protein [Dysgonomonas sp. Marseille-P4677]|uniref:nuclear transport factor 2 family protein n=1 Tax=Dysgonomonas sp. Marseille-P4677 TaxID=2364790 RepID=UPI001913CBCD|nr:nuclear transport factor 2 family protein [Dysgonomonas sp. Marseille-P4677]MBK5722182.1 nuclear transport factor 2 family protein [Dysgonomonas sp. Marseille-P4677]